MKKESEVPGAPFGSWEEKQVERVLSRDFLRNFCPMDRWLGLERRLVIPTCASLTSGIRSLLALQATAEHRSIELGRFLSRGRIPSVVFAYCPPFSFHLQTMHFTAITEDDNAKILYFTGIEQILTELEKFEEHVENAIGYFEERATAEARTGAYLKEVLERMIQLFQSWTDRKQQTAPLLKLLLPLHHAFNAQVFSGYEHCHWIRLFANPSPTECLI